MINKKINNFLINRAKQIPTLPKATVKKLQQDFQVTVTVTVTVVVLVFLVRCQVKMNTHKVTVTWLKIFEVPGQDYRQGTVHLSEGKMRG